MRAASRAKSGGFLGKIQAFSQVLLLDLLLHLLNGGLHLGGRHFGLDIGRTLVAKRPLGVPARGLAHPVRTLGALPEIGLGFINASRKALSWAGPWIARSIS